MIESDGGYVPILPRKDDKIRFEKEANGLCLFYRLHGVFSVFLFSFRNTTSESTEVGLAGCQKSVASNIHQGT